MVKIPVSVFASCIGYCKYHIINRFHLGIEPKRTQAQAIGQKIHDKLEEEDLLVEREEATKEELQDPMVDLDLPRESMFVSIERTNKETFRYVGRMDKVVRSNGNMFIIDDKVSSSSQPKPLYPGRLAQLSCYCEGFTRNFSNEIAFNKIFFKVIQRDRHGCIINDTEREYDNPAKQNLNNNFELFESIFNKDTEPEHHNNPNKCRACTFDCKWRL